MFESEYCMMQKCRSSDDPVHFALNHILSAINVNPPFRCFFAVFASNTDHTFFLLSLFNRFCQTINHGDSSQVKIHFLLLFILFSGKLWYTDCSIARSSPSLFYSPLYVILMFINNSQSLFLTVQTHKHSKWSPWQPVNSLSFYL